MSETKTSSTVRDDLMKLVQNARQYYNESFDGVSVLPTITQASNGLVIRYPDGTEFDVWVFTGALVDASDTDEGAGELPQVPTSE